MVFRPDAPLVRSVHLIVIAQLSREVGQRAGLDLHPVTDGRGAMDAFGRFLELAPMPSRGHVVGMDLEVVGIDLETIALDDVLAYRRENADAPRRYMQNLRAFARDLSLMEKRIAVARSLIGGPISPTKRAISAVAHRQRGRVPRTSPASGLASRARPGQ